MYYILCDVHHTIKKQGEQLDGTGHGAQARDTARHGGTRYPPAPRFRPRAAAAGTRDQA